MPPASPRRRILGVVFLLGLGLPWVFGEYALQVILDHEASLWTYLVLAVSVAVEVGLLGYLRAEYRRRRS